VEPVHQPGRQHAPQGRALADLGDAVVVQQPRRCSCQISAHQIVRHEHGAPQRPEALDHDGHGDDGAEHDRHHQPAASLHQFEHLDLTSAGSRTTGSKRPAAKTAMIQDRPSGAE
jgi:hypothetical protein